MNPRDYENLIRAMSFNPNSQRAQKADKLLQQLGYMQVGQYDVAHRLQGLPLTTLHGIKFVRPHYYAVTTVMVNVLRAYKDQRDTLPPPNLDHLRLAEFIYHAPRVWWRSLDPHRAHIAMCAEAGSAPDVTEAPSNTVAGRSATFAQVSGIRMTPQQPFSAVQKATQQAAASLNRAVNQMIYANANVPRNTVYQVHNPSLGSAIMPASSNPPTTPYASTWKADPVTTHPYETPLFTWLLEFTKSIRSLSLNSAAVV